MLEKLAGIIGDMADDHSSIFIARACLEALREPSETMVEAAMARWGGSSKTSPATANSRKQIWQAMIDAALSDPS